MLVNEGGGEVLEFDGRRALRRLRGREGRLPLHARDRAASRATPRSRASATTRCSSSRRCSTALSRRRRRARAHARARRAADAARAGDGRRSAGGARARSRRRDPRLAMLVEPMLGVTLTPTMARASREDQRDPLARGAQGGLPRAARAGRGLRARAHRGGARRRRLRARASTSAWSGNRSPLETAADGRTSATGSPSEDPGARGRAHGAARLHRLALVPRGVPGLRGLRLLPAAHDGPASRPRRSSTAPTSGSTVEDLGLRRTLLRGAGARRCSDEQAGEAPPRRHGAAQRPAGARPDSLGGRGAHARRRDPGGLRPQARLARALGRVPGVRGVSKLAEAFAVIPLVKRALPEARLPMEDATRARRDARGAAIARRALRRACRARAGRRGRGGRARPGARRCSRCAAASSPPTTGSSTRRSPPTSRATTTPRERPRSTTAAARNLVAPLLAATAGGSVLPCAAPGARGPLADAGVARRRRWRSRSRCSPGQSATPSTRASKALRRPGYELQRLMGTREPTARQLEVGRPRSTRYCASRKARHYRRTIPQCPRAPAQERLDPSVFRLPVETDPGGLLLGRLLQPHQDPARGRGSPSARDHAGVPEAATRCSAGSTRRWRS